LKFQIASSIKLFKLRNKHSRRDSADEYSQHAFYANCAAVVAQTSADGHVYAAACCHLTGQQHAACDANT